MAAQTPHTHRSTQSQSQPTQSQTQRQDAPDTRPNRAAQRRDESIPGEDPGTLSDEETLEADGPDALDAVTTDEHPDSPPDTRRDQTEDPERVGGGADRSQLM